MPRDVTLFLDDILEHISYIEGFLLGLDCEIFEDELQLRQSVYWSLFSISEAVTEVLRQEPALDDEISEHRDIKSMRNVLAHSYFALNPRRVWDTCESSLPVLKAEIEAIRKRRSTGS
jgi:uncharacterized protein with HEPN domain